MATLVTPGDLVDRKASPGPGRADPGLVRWDARALLEPALSIWERGRGQPGSHRVPSSLEHPGALLGKGFSEEQTSVKLVFKNTVFLICEKIYVQGGDFGGRKQIESK